MQSFKAVVINEVGLHARPAAVFVQTAAKFKSKIRVRNLTTSKDFVDAKSILAVLMLGVSKNHEIEVEVTGDDELFAANVLKQIIENNFTGYL